MAKPETVFTASVDRHLPPRSELWREKMSNPYRAGGADYWYSGKSSDLWVEWKFIIVPKRDDTIIDLVGGKDPAISKLQQSWLRDRSIEGRRVWVIVGSKDGGVIFERRTWEEPLSTRDFRNALLSRLQLAQLIASEVGA